MPIRFGTDGWRGLIARDFTFDNVELCAEGLSQYLKSTGLHDRGLVLGYDTRFLSNEFATTVADVVTKNGIQVFMCDEPTPTPVVSYNITTKNAGGGVVITASHNPYQWNGFKYKSQYGGSASPEIVESLEGYINSANIDRSYVSKGLDGIKQTGLLDVIDAKQAYIAHISNIVNVDIIRNAGLRVVVDSMYGAGARYLSDIISGGTTEAQELHSETNPNFPDIDQPEPISQNLGSLCRYISSSNFDAGLALDGDADRFGLVDNKGNFITRLEVFALLTLYLLDVKGYRGPIVKSITSTSMIYRLAAIYDVPVFETPVGFKYVGPKMIKEQAIIGGEESGGFGYKGHIPERDGILSALLMVEMMSITGKNPSELILDLRNRVGEYSYKRVDVTFSESDRSRLLDNFNTLQPSHIAGIKVSKVDDLDGRRFILEDESWLIVRFSGTEPLLRIYSESENTDIVNSLINNVRDMLGV